MKKNSEKEWKWTETERKILLISSLIIMITNLIDIGLKLA